MRFVELRNQESGTKRAARAARASWLRLRRALGSGSAGTAQLAIVAYVPKPKSNKTAEKVDVTAGRPPCGHGTRACREGQAAQDGDQGGRQEGRRDRGRRRDGRPRLLMHDHRVARGRPVAAAHGDAGDERKSRPACRGAQGLLGLRGQDDLPSTATRRPR